MEVSFIVKATIQCEEYTRCMFRFVIQFVISQSSNLSIKWPKMAISV